MAFYASDFDDFGEYKCYSTSNYSTSYEIVPFQSYSSSSNDSTSCYDIVPFQDSTSLVHETVGYDSVPFQYSPYYSSYEYTEPYAYEYDTNAYQVAYDPSEVNYYAHNLVEPKLLEYNPVFDNTHYFASDTRFIISYSNAPVLDDTAFDDYDPTPYDGGYDIAQTYGKPLQPTDQICYPRSVPNLDSTSPIFPYGSIPSPYGKTEEIVEKMAKSEPILEKEQLSGANGDSNVNEPEKHLELSEGEMNEGHNLDNGEKNGDYGKYGYGNQNIQFQGTYNGCGLEAMDLCEGLFGYWPCLDKKIRRECRNCEQIANEENQWKSAADYLFGSYGHYNYD